MGSADLSVICSSSFISTKDFVGPCCYTCFSSKILVAVQANAPTISTMIRISRKSIIRKMIVVF